MADRESRIAGVGGAEFRFERSIPDKAGRKVGERKIAAEWTAAIKGEDKSFASAVINEFDDGVLFGPSSVPGAVSDFAGAAAAEVTVRWLQLANQALDARLRRQREVSLAVGGLMAALLILALVF